MSGPATSIADYLVEDPDGIPDITARLNVARRWRWPDATWDDIRIASAIAAECWRQEAAEKLARLIQLDGGASLNRQDRIQIEDAFPGMLSALLEGE